MNRKLLLLFTYATIAVAGCRQESESSAQPEAQAPSTPANRIDIPPTVRSNLGITFASVEVREVARTIRVPGSFELSPEARREYRTMVNGRAELHVTQYAAVQPGQLLFTLDSPDWRELQQQLNDTQLKLEQAQASASAMGPLIAAHERHHDELQRAVEIWQTRVDQLESSRASGVVTDEDFAQARGTLATSRAELAEVLEKEAELKLRQAQIEAELRAHRERLELMLANAGSLLSLPVKTLLETDPDSAQQHPRWREIRRIEIRAESPGVVELLNITNGAWANESTLVMTTVQPDQLRFRAMGMQADLPRLANGATARIAPPRTPGLDVGDSVAAELTFGLDAHPDNRTITLIARPDDLRTWMRPGVSAFLEVVAENSDGPVLAIPRSAIVKDGITHVYFRRDPKNPNQAIRMEADMGVNDGRWVVMHSGLMRGDEVVLDGAYELKLATAQSGTSQKGGHFHADGAFHDEH
jgi:multidrug efflux pump subunit AcrA (membrane-fusion protein)